MMPVVHDEEPGGSVVAVAVFDNLQPDSAEELAFATGDALIVLGQEVL